MIDCLQEVVTFERISVISKLGNLEGCNDYDRQVVLMLITELADNAKEEISKKKLEK